MRTISYLSPAIEVFSIDFQAVFEYEDLYVHEVLGEIAYKWLIVHAIFAPYLDRRIANAWYDNDTISMSTK
jgi:hypothetical protein